MSMSSESSWHLLENNRDAFDSVIDFLGFEDVVNLSHVNKFALQHLMGDYRWLKFLKRDFGPCVQDWKFTTSAKLFCLKSYPRVGDVFELVDTYNLWAVARVVFVLSPKQVYVYYEGWSEKYNEWIDLDKDSHRIRPLTPNLSYVGNRGPLDLASFLRQTHRAHLCVMQEPEPDFVTKETGILPGAVKDGPAQHGSYRTPDDLMIRQTLRHPFWTCRAELYSPRPPRWLRGFPKREKPAVPQPLQLVPKVLSALGFLVETPSNPPRAPPVERIPLSLVTNYEVSEISGDPKRMPALEFGEKVPFVCDQ